MAFDVVSPRRRIRVFEIGHEDVRAGIERIDDHLAIDGAGDLDAAVLEVTRDRRDAPVALANLFRIGKEVRQFAGVEALLALLAFGEQLFASRIEFALQRSDELQRRRCEDLLIHRSTNLDLSH